MIQPVSGYGLTYDYALERIHILSPDGGHLCCFPHREEELMEPCNGFPFPKHVQTYECGYCGKETPEGLRCCADKVHADR